MSGRDIKIERVTRGIKQLELSRQTGINPSRLSLIENGWAQARDEELTVIRAALNPEINLEGPDNAKRAI